MAQNISLMGAVYNAVPGVDLPKSGGGTARFTDVTDTTAAAEDVASGKYFYTAAGVRTAGTASGGGGSTTLKFGVLRPDAELVETWSFDKYAVRDLELTIPAYSTTATTMVASGPLTPKFTPDFTNYNYFVLIRTLTIPSYNVTTKGKGREEYQLGQNLYELVEVPANTYQAIIEPTRKVTAQQINVTTAGAFNRIVYYTSGTALGAQSTSYGAYQAITSPTWSSPNLTIQSPSMMIRGSTTYLTSTYMNALTDIRYQYKVEMYRAAKGSLNLNGWGIYTHVDHIIDCIKNNNGTLT